MPGDDERHELEQRIEKLEQQNERLAERVEALAEQVPGPQWKQWVTGQVQTLQAEGSGPGVDPERLTTLEKYAQMPMEERQASLGASDLRATLILENWTAWCQRGPYGDEAITTAMTRPATLRVLLREQDPTVEVPQNDLHRQQVYRAMRAVHRLTDGAIEYIEDHATPDNTDSGTCHALVLREASALPTLYQE